MSRPQAGKTVREILDKRGCACYNSHEISRNKEKDMFVYADNAATTRVRPAAMKAYLEQARQNLK